MSMNLKPYRDISDHEVINGLFSTVEGTLTKGSFLQVVSLDPDNMNGYGASVPGVPAGAWAATYEVYGKVKLATTVTGTLGLSLYDVYPVGTNTNIRTIGDQRRYYDQVPSGQAVAILTKGIVEIGGFSGTAYPGAKGTIVAGTPGQLGVAAATTSPNVGTFLSVTGADGYAIFKLNCP